MTDGKIGNEDDRWIFTEDTPDGNCRQLPNLLPYHVY